MAFGCGWDERLRPLKSIRTQPLCWTVGSGWGYARTGLVTPPKSEAAIALTKTPIQPLNQLKLWQAQKSNKKPLEDIHIGRSVNSSSEIITAIFEAKKFEDLECLGREVELQNLLNEVFQPFVLSVDTYEQIFAAVEAIRSSLSYLKSYPFVSRQAQAVYALTELDGVKRNECLGVTEEIYKDKALARQWYKSWAQLIHSDKIGGDPVPMQLLKKLYEKITHEPSPE